MLFVHVSRNDFCYYLVCIDCLSRGTKLRRMELLMQLMMKATRATKWNFHHQRLHLKNQNQYEHRLLKREKWKRRKRESLEGFLEVKKEKNQKTRTNQRGLYPELEVCALPWPGKWKTLLKLLFNIVGLKSKNIYIHHVFYNIEQ